MWASKIHKYTFIVSIYVTSCQIVVQNYLALLAHILNGVNQNDPGVLKSEALIAATLLLWNLENEEKKLTNAWEFCSLINIMNIMKLDRQKDFYVVNRVYTHTHFFSYYWTMCLMIFFEHVGIYTKLFSECSSSFLSDDDRVNFLLGVSRNY